MITVFHPNAIVFLKKYDNVIDKISLNTINVHAEDIRKVSASALGWYRRCGMSIANYLLSIQVPSIKWTDRPGIVNPLENYLSN